MSDNNKKDSLKAAIQVLASAAITLRARDRVDYFVGMSMSDIAKQRADAIGEDSSFDAGNPSTELGALAQLKNSVAGAIELAKASLEE